MPGAISFSNSTHFALNPYSREMNPVALPPGRARLSTKPAPTGSARAVNTIGTVRVACSNAATAGLPLERMTSDASATNSAAYSRTSSALPRGPAGIDLRVAADAPTQFLQPLQERCDAGLSLRIVRGLAHEHADAPHPLALLRTRRERPRGRRTAEQRDELAPLLIRSPHQRSAADEQASQAPAL